MKNTILILLSAISLAGYTQDVEENSLLWSIEKEGQATSYLFGTMHARDIRVHCFFDQLTPYMNQCKAVYGELDPKPEELGKAMKMALLDSGQTLASLTGQAFYDSLVDFVGPKLGFGAMMLPRSKPIIASTLLLQANETPAHPLALDARILDYAKRNNLQTGGLETIDEQVKALETISLEEQTEMLKHQFRTLDDSTTNMKAMLRLYSTQDLKALWAYYKSYPDVTNFEENLIVERNNNMSERMLPLMEKQATFFAVGALHLPTEIGLIHLLRQTGYTVKPVNCACKIEEKEGKSEE